MAADHRAIEQQHRYIEREPPLEHRIRIDVGHLDGRQRHGLPERLQLLEHLLAEVAIAPVDEGENGESFRAAARSGRKDPRAAIRSGLTAEPARTHALSPASPNRR